MPESLGDAVLDLRTDQVKYNRDIDKAQHKAQGLDKTFQSTSASLKKLGGSLQNTGRRLSIFVTLPLLAAAGAAVKLAVDAEETSSKFDVVMGPAAERLRQEFEDLGRFMALTTSEMEAGTAGLQDMLVPMGLSRDLAADLSLETLKLAGDISSFNNVATDEVLNAFKSALAGQSEPMRRFGVDTRMTVLEQVALEEGLIEAGQAMNQAAMAQAVLIQATRQSTDAMGDQERTVDSTSNQMRLMWKDLRDLGETIGKDLIPIVRELTSAGREVLSWFRDMDDGTRQWVVRIGLAVAAIGPLLFITGTLIKSVGSIVGVYGRVIAKLAIKTTATKLDTFAIQFNSAATVENTTANIENTTSLIGKAGLVAAVGASTFALTSWIMEASGAKKGLDHLIQGWEKIVTKINPWIDSQEELNAELALTIAAQKELFEANFQVTSNIVTGEIPRLKLIEQTVDAGEAAKKAAVAYEEKLGNALSSLGLVTAADAALQLKELSLAVNSGIVPATQMAPLIFNMRQEWEELGLLTPELEEKLKAIKLQMLGQAGAAEILHAAMLKLIPTEIELIPIGEDLADVNKRIMEELEKAAEAALANWKITQLLSGENEEAALAAEAAKDEYEKMAEALEDAADAGDAATNSLVSFFTSIKTGIPWLDTLINGIGSFINALMGDGGLGDSLGGIGEMISGLFGSEGGIGASIGGVLQNLFGGVAEGIGSGFMSSLTGIFGSIGSLIPVIGPLIAPLIGPLVGFIKDMFGPSAEELAARETVSGVHNQLVALLDTQQQLEAGGDLWKQVNVAQRDAMLALGFSISDVEQAWEQFKDAAKDPTAAAAMESFWAEKMGSVQSMLAESGLSLTELRNKMVNAMAKGAESVEEAFQVVMDKINKTTTETAEASEAAASTTETAFNDAADSVSDSAATMSENISSSLEDTATTTEEVLANAAAASAALAEDTELNFINAADSVNANTTSMVDGLVTGIAIATEAIGESLSGVGEDVTELVEGIEASFSDLNFTVGVGFSAGNAPGGGSGPMANIFHGDIPALGEGGLVTEATLAMVGENEPEAVIPLSSLKGSKNEGTYRACLHFVGGSPTQAAAFRGLAPLLENAKVDIKLLRRG